MFGDNQRLSEIEAILKTLREEVRSPRIFQAHLPSVDGEGQPVREDPDITVNQAIRAILDYLKLDLASQRQLMIPMKVTAVKRTKGGSR